LRRRTIDLQGRTYLVRESCRELPQAGEFVHPAQARLQRLAGLGGLDQAAPCALKLAHHGIELGRQPAHLVGSLHRYVGRQIPGAHVFHCDHQLSERTADIQMYQEPADARHPNDQAQGREEGRDCF
jgi:hypothetical protein